MTRDATQFRDAWAYFISTIRNLALQTEAFQSEAQRSRWGQEVWQEVST